jgi:RimJ/RimL family protein N-acetyltransferase
MWGVQVAADGSLIGTATLHTINRRYASAELGILIGEKDYWGGTTAEDVLSLVIDFGFGPAQLHRLTAGTYSRHWGMNLVYKKLGFTLEGTLRAAGALDDQYADCFRWGLLATEWKGRKRE